MLKNKGDQHFFSILRAASENNIGKFFPELLIYKAGIG